MDKLNFFRDKNGAILLSKSDAYKILAQQTNKGLNPRVLCVEQDGVEFMLKEADSTHYVLTKKRYHTANEFVVETYNPQNGRLASVYTHNPSLNLYVIKHYNATGQVVEIHTTKETSDKIWMSKRYFSKEKGLGSCRISCDVRGKKVFEREETRNAQGELVKVSLQRDGLLIDFDLTPKQAPFTLKNFARICLGLTPVLSPRVIRRRHNSSFGSQRSCIVHRFNCVSEIENIKEKTKDKDEQQLLMRQKVASFRELHPKIHSRDFVRT